MKSNEIIKRVLRLAETQNVRPFPDPKDEEAFKLLRDSSKAVAEHLGSIFFEGGSYARK